MPNTKHSTKWHQDSNPTKTDSFRLKNSDIHRVHRSPALVVRQTLAKTGRHIFTGISEHVRLSRPEQQLNAALTTLNRSYTYCTSVIREATEITKNPYNFNYDVGYRLSKVWLRHQRKPPPLTPNSDWTNSISYPPRATTKQFYDISFPFHRVTKNFFYASSPPSGSGKAHSPRSIISHSLSTACPI